MNHNPTTDPQWFGAPSGGRITLQELEAYGHLAAEYQFYANWNIGDVARIAARRFPDTWQQVFPEWISPDHIARCKAVAEAYPYEDRNPQATWSVHMQNAKRPDRVEVIRAHVEAGHTSDEARRLPAPSTASANDWLLAIDVNYFIHKYFYSGAGVEAAASFAGWLSRLIDRLKEKGLTDVVCCLDSQTNHRKKLTEDWEHQYKGNRGTKDVELQGQVNLVPDLLRKQNLTVVSIDDMEADDVMASYAVQFPGRVTLLTADKDMRQCLSQTCNILLDCKFVENTETGDYVPEYTWVTATSHTKETGLRPDQWICKQTIFGDAVDNIKGADNIGDVGSTKLVQEFGSARKAVEAAKRMDASLLSMPRGKIMAAGLLDLEERFEITRQLVALRIDLRVQKTTRLS